MRNMGRMHPPSLLMAATPLMPCFLPQTESPKAVLLTRLLNFVVKNCLDIPHFLSRYATVCARMYCMHFCSQKNEGTTSSCVPAPLHHWCGVYVSVCECVCMWMCLCVKYEIWNVKCEIERFSQIAFPFYQGLVWFLLKLFHNNGDSVSLDITSGEPI